MKKKSGKNTEEKQIVSDCQAAIHKFGRAFLGKTLVSIDDLTGVEHEMFEVTEIVYTPPILGWGSGTFFLHNKQKEKDRLFSFEEADLLRRKGEYKNDGSTIKLRDKA